MNDPLYNHVVFGPEKGKDGNIGKTDEELIHDLISIHNAENWLGGEGDDFAPNFFSAVIPPESTSAATPASSSDSSVGVASGVSSRSQTPEEAVATVSPTESKPASEIGTTGSQVNAVAEAASEATIQQNPEAAVTTSPLETVSESVASGFPACLAGTVNTETPADTAITDGVALCAEKQRPSQKEGNSPEAASKIDEG